jgi:diaminopimelate decarboxylase
MHIVNPFNNSDSESFYVFDLEKLKNNYNRLQYELSLRFLNYNIYYSYKTNYIPALLTYLHKLGAKAEVVSGFELRLALKLGVEGKDIIFNGPHKNDEDLLLSLQVGAVVNIDSEEELNRIEIIQKTYAIQNSRIGIRLMFTQEEGQISRFGVSTQDPERFIKIIRKIVSLSSSNQIACVHCHLPTRNLDSWRSRTKQMADALEYIKEFNIASIDFGGGMSGPMPKSLSSQLGTVSYQYSEYAGVLGEFGTKIREKLKYPYKLIIEPGTALVADVGNYYCRVNSIKKNQHGDIISTTGSLHCFGSIGSSINYPFEVIKNDNCTRRSEVVRNARVVGYSCIERDVLAYGYEGSLALDDILEFKNAGSYSVVMKPQFIQLAPEVYIRKKNGEFVLVRRKEELSDVLSTYNW